MAQMELWRVETIPPRPLLKWIGNKHRFASTIANVFPTDYKRYFEPFVGTGAVLGALAPARGIAGDILTPLIEIWNALHSDPSGLLAHYEKHWKAYIKAPLETYEAVKASYNKKANGYDLLFLSRTCYGGVVRFRQKDGYMSTPIGPHRPIPPMEFERRMSVWQERTKNTKFFNQSFEKTMSGARAGDIVYCDPPYTHSQAILYGAQSFELQKLFAEIDAAASRGALVALSIDGMKKSGEKKLHIDIPDGLFKRQLFVDCGRSMLKRFWRPGQDVADEVVHDRLLLTW